MRILIGTDTYLPHLSGAVQFTRLLAEGLVRRGHEVHLVCPAAGEAPRTGDDLDGVRLHELPSLRYPPHDQLRLCLPWQTAPAVDRIVAAVRPDVIHIQSNYVIGRQLATRANADGIALVGTNHAIPENLTGYVPLPERLLRLAFGWVWRDTAKVFSRADVVTVPTPYAVRLFERRTGLRGVRAVSCGVDLDVYRPAARTTARSATATVLFVGRLDQEKRVDVLVRAAAALRQTLPVAVDIVGQGKQLGRLKALAAELGCADAIRFRGFVAAEELRTAYAQASVFCMPSVAELQSIATLEAMSVGLPIVAADAMALPHLVTDDVNGFLFAPGDVDGLRTRLETILSDPLDQIRMGRASRAAVVQHGHAATLDTFEAIYTGLAQHRRYPRPADHHPDAGSLTTSWNTVSNRCAETDQANCAAWARPAVSSRRHRVLWASERMASAKAVGSSGGTNNAAVPATSRKIGMSLTTSGVPAAMASTSGMPNPSSREALTRASAKPRSAR